MSHLRSLEFHTNSTFESSQIGQMSHESSQIVYNFIEIPPGSPFRSHKYRTNSIFTCESSQIGPMSYKLHLRVISNHSHFIRISSDGLNLIPAFEN